MTLIEVMVALSILLVGLLGMLQLHLVGMRANAGGRMATQGEEIARELAAGLERLQFGDPLLADSGSTGTARPTPFGPLVTGTGDITAGAHEWSDATPIPGVRLSTELPGGATTYARRWTVWGYSEVGGGTASYRLVAASVTWTEPGLARPREAVVYTQVRNPVTLFTAMAVNR
jgi:type IV pilus assembly protein PilV